MKSTIRTRFFLTICLMIIFFGCGEDSPVTPVGPVEEPQIGMVSGTITNAKTGRPVRGAVVNLLGRQRESDAGGRYSFAQVDFSDAITITVEALDYAVKTWTFALKAENLTLDIPLAPLTNPEEEIQELLGRFSELIETVDLDKLEEIGDLFTEEYIASDDLVTRFFGLNTGVIPVNYDDVTPAITALFEEFNRVQYRFHDIEMNIPHTRQASARLGLDIITEKGARSVRREMTTKCEIYFRKEESSWRIFFWPFSGSFSKRTFICNAVRRLG
jgi:hypothetical protein